MLYVLSDSPKLIWTHLISSRITNSHSDSPSPAWIQSDSLSRTRIHYILLRLSLLCFLSASDFQMLLELLIPAQIHSNLLRFVQICSNSFSFTSDSDRSRSSQIHPFLFRFTQTHTYFLNAFQISLDLLSLTHIHTRFRSIQIPSDSLIFFQVYSDSPRITWIV